MAIPASAAILFGIKGARAAKGFWNQGKRLFGRLHPKTAKISTGLPKKTEIKTAKPAKVNPAKVKPTPEEKSKVMSWYKGGSMLPSATTSLKPQGLDKPVGYKDVSRVGKTKVTKFGRSKDRKDSSLVLGNPNKGKELLKKDLEKDYAMGELFGTRS